MAERFNGKETEINVFGEQVNLLYKNLFVGIVANFICASVVFITLFHEKDNYLSLIWFVAVILVSLFRLITSYFYHRSNVNKKLYLKIFIIGMSFSAALWGMAGSILMPNNLLKQMVILVIIAGITSGGMQSLNASRVATMTYISLIIIPLCIWLFIQGGLTYVLLDVAMLTYLFFMLTTSSRGCKILKETLTLRYQKSALIQNLSSTNRKLIQINKTLEQHECKLGIINKMNGMLQICKKSDEAYEIISLNAKELFSQFSGGLIMLTSSGTLKTVIEWGNDRSLKSILSSDDCFALRRGHTYLVNDTTKAMLCYHFDFTPAAYLCVPLITQTATMGVLVLHSPTINAFTSYQLELATGFSEVIQLSLTNIKLREKLYEQSIHDPLTGLFNRRYLDETLERELQTAIRENLVLSVVMLDLDFFKRFNDSSGHEAGDQALKFIGSLLKNNFRANDIACRFGGEEFILILVNSDLDNAYERLQQVRDEVKRAKIYYDGLLLPPITISIGIAEAPKQGSTVKDIIQAADQALYAAKQEGRDRVKCFGR